MLQQGQQQAQQHSHALDKEHVEDAVDRVGCQATQDAYRQRPHGPVLPVAERTSSHVHDCQREHEIGTETQQARLRRDVQVEIMRVAQGLLPVWQRDLRVVRVVVANADPGQIVVLEHA